MSKDNTQHNASQKNVLIAITAVFGIITSVYAFYDSRVKRQAKERQLKTHYRKDTVRALDILTNAHSVDVHSNDSAILVNTAAPNEHNDFEPTSPMLSDFELDMSTSDILTSMTRQSLIDINTSIVRPIKLQANTVLNNIKSMFKPHTEPMQQIADQSNSNDEVKSDVIITDACAYCGDEYDARTRKPRCSCVRL